MAAEHREEAKLLNLLTARQNLRAAKQNKLAELLCAASSRGYTNAARPVPFQPPRDPRYTPPMPAKDHAVWDIVSDNPLRWWPSEARRRRNAAARTAFLDDPETTLSPDRLHATLKARLKPGELLRSRKAWIAGMGMGVCMILGQAVSGAYLLKGYTLSLKPNGYHLIPLFGIVTGIVMCFLSRPALRASRIWRRALARRCPDCNYDLSASHADPPLDPQARGINLGPRHCPECGALWPLVPPPVTASPTR